MVSKPGSLGLACKAELQIPSARSQTEVCLAGVLIYVEVVSGRDEVLKLRRQ